MKKLMICYLLSFVLLLQLHSIAQPSSEEWTKRSSKKWFNKQEWLQGSNLTPHASIDKIQFARQYHLNKQLWDEAFNFLKMHNLDSLPKGKYIIDEDNVTASVTEDPSKDFDKTTWESHRRYIDLQCIVAGEEKMGVYPVAKSGVAKEYDEKKDVANYTAPGKFYIAGPQTFLLFFPSDAHRPNITPGGNKVVKKIVLKIKVAG